MSAHVFNLETFGDFMKFLPGMKQPTGMLEEILCALFLCLLSTPVGLIANPVKLGIIAENSAAQTPADLLTAILSGKQGLALVERSEIEKLIGEQTLSALNRKDYVKLGQTLGADGIFFLRVSSATGGTQLDVSLVAVKPGVVLRAKKYPWPLEDLDTWSKLAVRQFEPLLPKTTVLAKDAVPVSILNLRSAIKSFEAERLERELTTLLIHQLTQEKAIFVLERRQLQQLETEKNFAVDDSPFWSGAYLLEGTVDQTVYSPEAISINARLTPPHGAPVITLAVSGKRDQPWGIIQSLAKKITEALKLNPSDGIGDLGAERELYFQEAEWAYRWGMYNEAQAASEAGWALGLRSKPLALLRIRSYARGAGPNSAELVTNLYAQIEYLQPPRPQRLDVALRTLELWQNYEQEILRGETKPDTVWHTLGLEVVEVVSGLLQHYYKWYAPAPEVRARYEEKLRIVRAKIREVAGRFWADNRKEVSANQTDSQLGGRNIAWEQATYGGLWHDRPVETLASFRKLASTGHARFLRLTSEASLVGWAEPDQAAIPELWKQFLTELCVSSDPSLRLEGRLLALKAIPPNLEGEALAAVQQIVSELAEHRAQIYSGEIDPTISRAAGDGIMARFAGGGTPERNKIRDLYLNLFFGDTKYYFEHASTFDWDYFKMLNFGEFTREQARELVSILESYGARLPQRESQIDSIIAVMKSKLAPPEVVAAARPLPVVSPKSSAGSSESVLPVRQYWNPQIPVPPGETARFVRIIAAAYKDGRLWLEYLYSLQDMSLTHNAIPAAIFSVNLATFKSEVAEFHTGTVKPGWHELCNNFDVKDHCLYVGVGATLKKYDFDAKFWKDIPMPVEDNATVNVIEGRVYLGSKETILEMDPETEHFRILASCRRRPAVNPLDALPAFDYPQIFKGPPGHIRAKIQTKIYTCNIASGSWAETAVLPLDGPTASREQAVFINTWEPYTPARGFGLRPDQTGLDLLYCMEENPASKPKWAAPIFSGYILNPGDYDGQSLILLERAPQLDVLGTNLWHFDPRCSKPIKVSFVLDRGNAAAKDFFGAPSLFGEPVEILIRNPYGLVLTKRFRAGFWFLPAKEYQVKVEQLLEPMLRNSKK